MAYKAEKIDLSETKKLLVQAITNTEFLRQIYNFADPHLLPDTYSKLILQWCFEFYDQFNEAPNSTIQTIYEKKANYVLKESDAEMIENILDSISNDYVIKGNVDYYVEQAELFFNKLSIKQLQDNIGKLADRGKIEDAVNLISKFKKVERIVPQGVDLLQNDEAIEEAFSEKEDKLFSLPGDLGHLLGSFNRGDLSAVMSPQKRGKCVVGDTYIVTSNGIKRIDGIVDNMGYEEKSITVATKDGIENTSHTYKTVTNNTREVELYNGVKIECTPEHPLFGINSKRVGWIKSQELTTEDYVAIKLGTNLYGSNHDIDKGFLLGALIANASKSSGFMFSSNNKKMNNKIINIIGHDVTELQKGEGLYIRKSVADELWTDGWKTARFKEVPEFVLGADKETQKGFLRGLFDCDSSLDDKKAKFEYATASKQLCYGVYTMLANMGIVSSIKESYNKQYKHTYYSIDIYMEDMVDVYDGYDSTKYGIYNYVARNRKFKMNRIPTWIFEEHDDWKRDNNIKHDLSADKLYKYKKTGRLNNEMVEYILSSKIIDKSLTLYKVCEMIHEGYRFMNVKGVKDIYEQKTVYDLTVPISHSFIANGIISHNTWAMMEIASHAMQSGKKVWFISLEMTRNQIIRRMWQQWTDSVAEEQEVTVPFFDRDGNIRTKTEKRKPMEIEEMTKLRGKFRLAMKQSQFNVYSYPKHTFKVSDLKVLLENSMMYKGEIPDLIVIDYASIMCPERHGEKRFELDQIWADLSAIAVEFNIHVLSASQTGRATLSRDVQQGDTSEAQSITSHVALMFALNQDDNDKAQSCIRYSCMFARHKGFLTTDQVVVLQNLACGKAMMDNLYEKYVPNLKSKDRRNKED